MTALLVFALKSSLLLAIFVSLFMLFMSRETFHRVNRFVLLLVVAMSLLLPFVNLGVKSPFDAVAELLSGQAGNDDTALGIPMPGMATVNIGELDIDTALTIPADEVSFIHSFDWMALIVVLYKFGIAVLLVRQLVVYIQLARIIARSKRVDALQYGYEGIELRVHSGEEKPFSWFGWVVVSESDLADGAHEILTHEVAHARAFHSWDIVLADIVIMLQWFNPLAWIMKNTLKDIHEFEADEAVINSGVNAKQYQLLIIKKAVGSRLYSIANSFNHSLTKKRITMMCKEKSNRWSCAKALYILPVAAIAALSFSSVENVNASEAETVSKVNEFAVNEANLSTEKTLASVKDTAEVVYQVVEVQPAFPGGSAAMAKFLGENIKYPEAAKAAGKEGRVIVELVVKADGSLANIAVVRSSGDKSLDDEAVRVVGNMPKWKPGMQGGKAVNVKFLLPIIYKLPKEANGNGVYMSEGNKEKLLVVSGGAVYDGDINDIDPATIESIEIVKLPDLTPELQEKLKQTGKEAVMYINFKKEKSASAVGNEAVFTVCEKMTEFPGGQQEMMKYLSTNMKYPIDARNAQLQGKLLVQFVVNKEGDIVDAKIAKGGYSFSDKLLNGATAELETLFGDGTKVEKLDEVIVVAWADGKKDVIDTSAPEKHPAVKSLEAEALRVVNSMPKWTPGMQSGKPVNVQFMLPLTFKLQ